MHFFGVNFYRHEQRCSMGHFCFLTSMELIHAVNCSLLFLHSNHMND